MSHLCTKREGVRRSAGFTLVELMITVAVMAILAAVATPAMQALIANGRQTGAASELTAAMQVARSEAVRRNSRVTVCATDGSATLATACNNSGTWTNWAILDLGVTAAVAPETTAQAVARRVIRNERAPASVQLTGPTGGVLYRPSGRVDAQAVIAACMPGKKPQQVTVMISGVVTKAQGATTCS